MINSCLIIFCRSNELSTFLIESINFIDKSGESSSSNNCIEFVKFCKDDTTVNVGNLTLEGDNKN